MGAADFTNRVKREFVEIIFTKQHWWHMSSLELTHAIHQATRGDIIADGLAEKRFCTDSAVRGSQIYKEFSFVWPGQFTITASGNFDKQLVCTVHRKYLVQKNFGEPCR